MPGDNCVIPGSSTSRATPGVTLLGMPKNYNEYNVNWRKNIVDMITTIRVVDASKLFLRKTLVNLTKKNREKYHVILHQQHSIRAIISDVKHAVTS